MNQDLKNCLKIETNNFLLIIEIPIMSTAGGKNILILYLSCRTSDLQFSLVLQTHAHVLLKCMQ